MALGFLYGAGGGGQSENVLYDKGKSFVGFDNIGNYHWQSPSDTAITLPVQFLTDKIYAPVVTGRYYMFGTTSMVDLTKYSEVHIRARGITKYGSGQSDVFIEINTQQMPQGGTYRKSINRSNTFFDYAVDVSALAESRYIFVYSNGLGLDFEIEKIWLT